MKIKSLIYYIFLVLVFSNSSLKGETIFFDSNNINVEESGNMVFATKGKAKIPSSNLIIEGEKFIYDKKNSELIIIDDVKYYDVENNIYIESQKIIYNEIKNIILSKSETYILSEEIYEINSFDVLYNRNTKKILSKEFTTVNDNGDNKFLFNSGLVLDLIKKIVSSNEVIVTDKNNNNHFVENSKINLTMNEIVGKEIKIESVLPLLFKPKCVPLSWSRLNSTYLPRRCSWKSSSNSS